MASALTVRTRITRRTSLLLTAAAAGSLLTGRGNAYSAGSQSAAKTPLPELASSLDEGVRSGRLQNLHAAVVVHRDEVLLERYYQGTDEWWGYPLGTVNFGPTVKHDIRSSSKSVAAASGLRMCPRDFARLGQLVLKGGRWQGTQVVPRQWMDELTTPRVRISTDVEYGYQWYLISGRGAHRWLGARGNGGQYLTVIPDLELVVALVAGNYNKGGSVSDAALADYILPKIS